MTRLGFQKGQKMERFERALAKPTRALKQIGFTAVAHFQKAFKDQALGAKAWQERSVPNVFGILRDLEHEATPPERRTEPRQALIDTGNLRDSINPEVGTHDVKIGTNVEYAQVHQEGGDVESETITPEIQDGLREWLKGQSVDIVSKMRWLLNPTVVGTSLTRSVPARPFIGMTKLLAQDIEEIIGVSIFEVGK